MFLLYQIAIYAYGLESLVGGEEESLDTGEEDDAEADEGPEPTAGMSFTFLDVLLTQVEFFRGTSGLMSAVWNAPSELTSALQVTFTIVFLLTFFFVQVLLKLKMGWAKDLVFCPLP